MPLRAPRRRRAHALAAQVRVCALVMGVIGFVQATPGSASAQSVDVGVGVGIPLQTFVEDEVGSQFRVAPEPGYYPTLSERDNALGSFHLHIGLVLDGYEFLSIFDDLEIRLDFASFGWSDATVTHTTCTPAEVYDGAFDPATANFRAVEDLGDCLPQGFETTTDVSELELPALQIFDLSVGGRARLVDASGWLLWYSAGLGLVISTFADPDAEFFLGASIASGFGLSYAVSDIFSITLVDARATFMVTEAPDSIQNRLDFDTSEPSWIGSRLLETFSWVDFQLGLSFAF